MPVTAVPGTPDATPAMIPTARQRRVRTVRSRELRSVFTRLIKNKASDFFKFTRLNNEFTMKSMLTKYKSSRMENGLTIISAESDNSDVAALGIWIKSGYRHESSENLGFSHLLEHMLLEGTKRWPSRIELAGQVERLGGYKNGHTDNHRMWFPIIIGRDQTEAMIDLMSDTILNPLMDPEVLEKEKQATLEEYAGNSNDAFAFSGIKLKNKVFFQHPASYHTWNDPKNVLRATVESLDAYRQKFLVPNRSALVVASSYSHSQIVDWAHKYFATWMENQDSIIMDKVPFSPIVKDLKYYEYRKSDQTQIIYGFANAGLSELSQKEILSLELIAIYLGAGSISALIQKLRVKLGLIYGAWAGFPYQLDAGDLDIKTKTIHPVEVLRGVEEVFENIPTAIDEKLLGDLKIQIKNTLLRNIETSNGKFNFLGDKFIDYDRLITPEEVIESMNALTVDDIRNANRKYLTPDRRFIGIFGPKDVF